MARGDMAVREITKIKTGDVALAVHQWGDPNQPTVLLVHGYPDSSEVWNSCAEILAQQFHVAAYDVRGAGQSSAPSNTRDYTLELLAADFKAVADAVSPGKPVHIVGHDWGSIQAWESVTDASMQGRIASFTSISGPCLDHVGHALRHGGLAGLARQSLRSWYIGAFHLPGLADTAWRLGVGRLFPPSATRQQDGRLGINLYRANVTERLLKPRARRTELPVQLIVPTRDAFVTPELLDGLSRWAPKLWRTEVDAGHWLPLSHPALLARKVAEFVNFAEAGQESLGLQSARVQGKRKSCSGKLVIVTGAGAGIGRETLLAFAELGATTIAADINFEAAESNAQLARLEGAISHARQLDVASASAMEEFAGWVAKEFGAPDILVNNAGIGMAGSFLDTTAADWEKILRINLGGVIHGSRLFAQQMLRERKSGHIVNVSSGLAYTPTRSTPAYATSKAAVLMLSDCLRAELADRRIKVLSVCPGVVNTTITQTTRFVGASEEEQRRQQDRAKKLFARRNLKPQAVAQAILYAIAHDKDEALVGAEAKIGRVLSRWLPSLSRRLARLDAAP